MLLDAIVLFLKKEVNECPDVGSYTVPTDYYLRNLH
jgi:hypothetical protein